MIRIGTRRSPLAQAQTDGVIARLPAGTATKVLVESAGDVDRISRLHAMERPGAFTHALTDAILDGRIDAAVHSLKDLPLDAPADAPIVAILTRDDPADLLVIHQDAADPRRPLGLKVGSRVGTSAPRRQAQISAADADLVLVDVRGNVGTRLHLVECGVVEGLLLAAAGPQRLKLSLPSGLKAIRLDPARFPGCPGQGTIAIQARRGSEAERLLSRLDDATSRAAVEAERTILRSLGGGCGLPLGAFATQSPEGEWNVHATLERDGRLVRSQGFGHSPGQAVEAVSSGLHTVPEPTVPGTVQHRGTVLLTLEEERVPAYHARIAERGWLARSWPLIATEPTSAPLPAGWEECAWVAVASPRAASYAAETIAKMPAIPRVAAVGAATAQALRRHGLGVHVVSREGTGADLANAIAAFPANPSRVLIPQAEEPAGGLVDGLHRHGFSTLPWPVYRTRARAPTTRPTAEAVLLTSPSAATAYKPLHGAQAPLLFAIGPTTAEAMRGLGLPVHATCPRPTPSGLSEVLP